MHRHKSTSTPARESMPIFQPILDPKSLTQSQTAKPYNTIPTEMPFDLSLKERYLMICSVYVVCLCAFLSAEYWPSAASFWQSKGHTAPFQDRFHSHCHCRGGWTHRAASFPARMSWRNPNKAGMLSTHTPMIMFFIYVHCFSIATLHQSSWNLGALQNT